MKVFFLVLAWALAQDRDYIPSLKRPSSSVGSLERTSEKMPVPAPVPTVATVEVFGSENITETGLRNVLGADLQKWLDLGIKGDPSAKELELKLAKKAQSHWDLAFAEWSVFQGIASPAIHITLDIVEAKDKANRMPFLNSPIGEFQDPDGILESWAKYENLAFELMQKGELLPMDAPQCPAFHCPFGHKHIQLKPFEKRFLEGARKHEKKLISIQAKDKRFEYRAAATYVLAYLKNGKLVVESMVARIRDPDSLVRNNALRVLSHIAEFHHQLFIPIDPVIAALDYPKVSDRSKAVLILHGLASHSEDNKARIREKGAAFLLKLLASGQPGHREPAHSVLRAISGKNYPMANLQAWKQWANSLPKRGVSHKP